MTEERCEACEKLDDRGTILKVTVSTTHRRELHALLAQRTRERDEEREKRDCGEMQCLHVGGFCLKHWVEFARAQEARAEGAEKKLAKAIEWEDDLRTSARFLALQGSLHTKARVLTWAEELHSLLLRTPFLASLDEVR